MLQRLVLALFVFSFAAWAQNATQSSKAKPTGSAPVAVLHTTAGDLKCELFPELAPQTVANFVGLATGKKEWTDPANGQTMRNKPLYDGVIFHRVIPEFMIQGGDPLGQGTGGPGYKFNDELRPDLLFDHPGRLAMANSGPNTNGSQFFITEQEQPGLNPCLDEGGCDRGMRHVPKGTGYTIFGQCDNHSVELVKKIAQGPCGGRVCDYRNSRPDSPVKINHVEILNAPEAAKKKPTATK